MIIDALLYHDVLGPGDGASGFTGGHAEIYKLAMRDFAAHLDAIEASGAGIDVIPDTPGVATTARRVVLTFDDGGNSARERIATMLEARGWRGQFFITTSRLNTPGFLSDAGVRELSAAGHVVGSHSHSHPRRIWACTDGELDDEWSRSKDILEEVLGRPVHSASVPGGYYDSRVAAGAARAGLRVLFTSEPRSRPWTDAGCVAIGRYSLMRNSPATLAAALCAGERWPRLRQRALWESKKVAKRLLGDAWPALRRRVFGAEAPR